MSNDLIQQRKEKITLWEELGFEPYGRKFDRTHTSFQAQEAVSKDVPRESSVVMKEAKSDVLLCGRIMNSREMGKLAFLRIRDRAGDFQICLAQNVLGDDFKKWLKALDLGDYCGFAGEFFLTKHGEPTLMATQITPLAKALRPLPEKWQGIKDKELCYRERNLDLMTNPETFKRFQVRSDVVKEIREFLHEKDFAEVETRVLQPQAGGAMARVFETHHNALDHEFVLRIALELDLKMCVSGGFERVFEIGKNFRNEGTDPSHLQEFSMLEWYAAYKDIETNKQWTQDLLQRICKNVLGSYKVNVLDKNDEPVEIDFESDFPSVRFPDLLKEHAKLDMFKATDEEVRAKAKSLGVENTETTGRANLLDDIYKKTARPTLMQPTFVLDYPEDLKPLARPNGDGTAACFQLLIAGWEVVNSYGELVNPIIQRELLERQSEAREGGDDEAMEIDEEFLKAMEHGFPPMTGSGIGVDRLVCLLMGQPNLRDVVLFPTMKPEKAPVSAKQQEEHYRSKKVVVIADPSLPAGVTANAMAQLGISIGGHSKEKLFDANVLHDKDGRVHYTDCYYGMSNLAGSQSQMADFVSKCYEDGVQIFDFTDVMRKAHTDDQMRKGYGEKSTKDLGYIAVGALVSSDWEKEFLSGLELFGVE